MMKNYQPITRIYCKKCQKLQLFTFSKENVVCLECKSILN